MTRLIVAGLCMATLAACEPAMGSYDRAGPATQSNVESGVRISGSVRVGASRSW